jgi:hypothetical protein
MRWGGIGTRRNSFLSADVGSDWFASAGNSDEDGPAADVLPLPPLESIRTESSSTSIELFVGVISEISGRSSSIDWRAFDRWDLFAISGFLYTIRAVVAQTSLGEADP